MTATSKTSLNSPLMIKAPKSTNIVFENFLYFKGEDKVFNLLVTITTKGHHLSQNLKSHMTQACGHVYEGLLDQVN